jgi:hypothetical protein
LSENQSAAARKLDKARQVARSLAQEYPIDCIYLGGSLTAQLGNATSDADLFAILAPGVQAREIPQQLQVGGDRVDVEWHPFERPRMVLEEILALDIRRDSLPQLWRLDDQLDFLCRLMTGEVVVGSAALDSVRTAIDEHEAALRRVLASRWGLEINTHLEDFIGACLEGDLDTALYVGQSMMTAAGKAVAAAYRDYYFGRKWVYRQLDRVAGKDFPLETFRRFQTGAWAENGAAGAEELIGFAQTMGAVAQVVALNGSPASDWTHWQRGHGGLFRSPHFLMIGLSDGMVLHRELRKQVVIRPHVALVWALCNGVDAAEVTRRAAELAPALIGVDLTSEQAGQIVAKLTSRDLVSDHPVPTVVSP